MASRSALGLALKGKSASVAIPKSREHRNIPGRDNLIAVSTGGRPGVLLTPPSSISPNLAPHRHPEGPVSPTTSAHQESDLDLHDEPHALNAEALDRLGELGSTGNITPGMLAKSYLPEILLANGPLAIRHIMGYLTTSVPGFSRITSAKARRLVVAALEGRGNSAEGAGMDGDVIFEKVGWGRWDARKRGQPPRDDRGQGMTPPGSLPSSYNQGGMQVPDRTSWRNGSDNLGTSLATSAGFSHSDEYHDVLEHEADKMSMDDDDDGYQSSEAPEPIDIDMDDGDVTDEEDWQSIGAEALRARSLPPGSLPNSGQMYGSGRIYQPISTYSTAPYSTVPRHQSRTPAQLAQSVPSRVIPIQKSGFNFASGVNDSQERAAIEALMSLGAR